LLETCANANATQRFNLRILPKFASAAFLCFCSSYVGTVTGEKHMRQEEALHMSRIHPLSH
jgi:hypothetical protein